MKGPLVWVGLLCLAALCLGRTFEEDDLVFDDVGEETPTLNAEASSESPSTDKPAKKHQRVEKLLGLPDAVAGVGHVFKLHVPKQAFTGNVKFYEASGGNGRGLPHWLRWDEPASALYGVASRKDIGRHRVNIKAFGKHGDVAQDSFIIHVVPEKNERFKYKTRCTEEQDRTMLTLLIDARYENLKPSAKVNALENLAGFLGLRMNSISIQPDTSKESLDGSAGTSVVLSGPGNVARRRQKHSTLVQWQVGCDGHFWPHQIDMIKQIPEQARDGTLSEVTQLPVYQWRVRSDPTDYSRNRRDTAGSGDDFLPDGDEEDDAEYEEGEDGDYDDDYDGNEGITVSPQEPKQKPVLHPLGGNAVEHPHRHHHGEDSVAGINSGSYDEDDDFIWRNPEINNALFNATTSTTTASTTIATTLPSSTTSSTTTPTTTTTTTTTTITTTTSTTEPPTMPSSTEWTTTSTTSTTTEEPSSPSETTTESTTTSTTTQATASATVETLTTETTTSTYTNLTVMVTGSSNTSANATIDSLTVDGEEALPTEREIEPEIDEDETTITTQEPSVFVASEVTTSSSGQFTSQSVVEVAATLEPNATSVLTVNASTEEYEEGQAPARDNTTSSSATGYPVSWGENATITEKVPGESLDPYETMHVPVFSSTPSTTTSTTTPSTTTVITTEATTPSTTTTITTTPSTTTTSTTPQPTTPSTTTTTTTTTTPAPTTPSTTPSTTTSTTTERSGFGFRNFKPEVRRRLKKLAVMQGKVLSYSIPDDTFNDPEDGNTRKLRLKLYDNGAPIKPSYWLQFNEQTHEVYGLPLEHDIGSYTFDVVAMDNEGDTTSVKLEVAVQQYKQIRAVNHEFNLYFKIEKKSAFPTNVDWELKVMRNLAELYGDHDLSYITVRSTFIQDGQAMLSWTNDSLVRSSVCPQEEIDRLFSYIVSPDGRETPSDELIRILGPELKPTRVIYEGLEQCQQIKETQTNNYPVPRNQIDQLNATVGQLFVFRVPKDTFFDSEDGDTRNLKATMLTVNRTEVPSWDWLQFDSRNQEFYGVPLIQDIGLKTYHLDVRDKGGLHSTDSLQATVFPAPPVQHAVEISMKLSMPYEAFVHSAQKKREFIEKLQKLYGDRNASAISLLSITGNREATVVTWRNLTLPTNECPQDEITRLRRVLVNDNKSFTDELNREFNSNSHQPEFNVMQITVSQTGACQERLGAGGPLPPAIDGDSTSVGASHDDYLITMVLPAIIIAAMLTLAGIIACILYKRRRSGKMSVSEKDDERQSFRSKGIPVIFQDELDEKPDPGNKSPIILKEEKPPLPPPEYQRAEDGADIPMLSKENSEEPYQPPPPFATNRDSNRQNRPKPTPTYRKPPPYVPP